MRYLWRGTRVCGPCVVNVGAAAPVVAVAIYGRGATDENALQYSVHTVLSEPFEFVAGRSFFTPMLEAEAAVAETDLGSITIRPLMASDARWLPVDDQIGHSVRMLESVLWAIDTVERMDHGGVYSADDEPVEHVSLLLSDAHGPAFALVWQADPDERHEGMWFRHAGSWTMEAPVDDRIWRMHGGPAAFSDRDTDRQTRRVRLRSTAVSAIMRAFDSGIGIGDVSLLLAAKASALGDHVFAGDLPAGAALELAQEWLASGGDPTDALVPFGEGQAELPLDVVLDASLARDQRVGFRVDLGAESGGDSQVGWRAMATLAVAAGERHLWHEEPCAEIHCQRLSFATALMSAEDPLDFFGERGGVVQSMTLLIWDLVRCMPVERPFDGLMEAPGGYIEFARRWREELASVADAFEDAHGRALEEAYARLFPSCGSIGVDAALERAGLIVPEPDGDDW